MTLLFLAVDQQCHVSALCRRAKPTHNCTGHYCWLKVETLNETCTSPGPAQGADVAGADDPSLTPKQRVERKREAERQKREMELRLASMNMAKENQVN